MQHQPGHWGPGSHWWVPGERNLSAEQFENVDTIVENWKELRRIKTDNAYVLARLEDNTTKMQIPS